MKAWYLCMMVLAACIAAPEPAPRPDFTQYVVAVETKVAGVWASIGSAVLIECKPSGREYNLALLTAAHVVERTSDLRVMFHDGVEVPIKKITPSKTRDAARLEGTSQKRRTAAQYTAKVPYAFEDVYAAGYPLGLGLVVTTGVINYPPANSREGSLMCSACAVYGNSGGGVFDITGKLIGITISVACYSSGIEANIVPHMHMFLPLYEISELIGE